MYYQVGQHARILPYLFSAMHDLPQKVDIGRVQLWQEGVAILDQEVVELLLAATFFLELTYVDVDVLGLVGVHLQSLFNLIMLALSHLP
jgi:hypothetical protein